MDGPLKEEILTLRRLLAVRDAQLAEALEEIERLERLVSSRASEQTAFTDRNCC